jgi:hypothetical protein
VSLRGGTTKQSVSFRRMPFVKSTKIVQLLCFIPLVWQIRLEVTWQIASSYLLAKTHQFGVLDLWVMDRACLCRQTGLKLDATYYNEIKTKFGFQFT